MQYEDMSIRSKATTLTPRELGIISRLPKAQAGDPKALDDLGLHPVKDKTPIESLIEAMDRQSDIRARELELMESGQLPEDWGLFQAWKYEITIGRLELPDALKEQYGPPNI